MICCSVLTCVNCAVCVRNCVLSVGASGSWYFICATSSFRKVSWFSWLLSGVTVGWLSGENPVGLTAVIACSCWWSCVRSSSSSHADVEQRRRLGSGCGDGRRGLGQVGGVVRGGVPSRCRRLRARSARVLARSDRTVRHGELTGVHAFGAEALG